MLLGPTGGGKTSVIKLLRTALATCHRDFYGLKSYEGISDLPGGVISSFSQVCTILLCMLVCNVVLGQAIIMH